MSIEYLTYNQAAKFLNMPKGTLYALVHERRVPHVRLSSRMVRFSRAELEAWLTAHRVPAREVAHDA